VWGSVFPKKDGNVESEFLLQFLQKPIEVNETGTLNLIISDELERQFREAIYKKYGMRKGNITKAVEDAITDWINKQNLQGKEK